MNEGKWRIVGGEDGQQTLYLFVAGKGHAAIVIAPPACDGGKEEVLIGFRNGRYVEWDVDEFGELLADLVAVTTPHEGDPHE